jgi:hypothetical protein
LTIFITPPLVVPVRRCAAIATRAVSRNACGEVSACDLTKSIC